MSESENELNGRAFAQLMLRGKTKAALRILCNKDSGRPLCLDELIDTGNGESISVREILEEKHPPAQPAGPESLVDTSPELVHLAVFDIWMLAASGVLHCVQKELLSHQELMLRDGGGYAPHLFEHLKSSANSSCCCQTTLHMPGDPRSLSPLLSCRFDRPQQESWGSPHRSGRDCQKNHGKSSALIH